MTYELLCIAAAILFTALGVRARRTGRPARALGTTALVFWGAALMWSVDCVATVLEGEGLFEEWRDDALLGALIVAAGVALFAVLRLRESSAPAA
jgi:drug/metabolite transporter (DMT)-like permease